jgi:PhzF family phenazine biosynthesis protein
MRIPIYQVDAFTRKPFRGNPAAVCPLEQWLDDTTLQAVAAENNLSETAFFVGEGGRYDLRWFTPGLEVDLCGHATLASAHILLGVLEPDLEEVVFSTRSGPLTVRRQEGRLAMDFPSRPGVPQPAPRELIQGLGVEPEAVFLARDTMAVLRTEEEVRGLDPSMEALSRVESLGVIATAPGREADFVSRFFAPRAGVPEDPVTGSAHCTLIPYWAERLGKTSLRAFQVSPRGGELFCEQRGDRVVIAGHAVTCLEGVLILPSS